MTRLRVGVIGVGVMGSNHARTLASLPGAILAGVMDADVARAQALADSLQCAVLSDIDAVKGACDAVIVAAATSAHASIGGHLLGMGLPCLIEKPLAGNDADCAALMACAQRAGLPLAVGHIERFNPAFRAARQRLTGCSILSLDARRLNPGSNRITDTDVIADLMLHDLDAAMLLLGGPFETVLGQGLCAGSTGLTDQATVLTRLGGVPASFSASRLWPTRVRTTSVLLADGTLLDIDFLTRTLIETRADGSQTKLPPDVDTPTPLVLEQTAFLDWVRTGDSGDNVTAEMARATLALVTAAQNAVRKA